MSGRGAQTRFENELPVILKQKGENTCWLAVTKMVLHFLGKNQEAQQVTETGAEPPGSAVQILGDSFGVEINMDDKAIPILSEMKDHIKGGGIFVSFLMPGHVNRIEEGKDPGSGVGHWIIINGVDTSHPGLIHVVDPDPHLNDEGYWITYGPNYQIGDMEEMHFVNASYAP